MTSVKTIYMLSCNLNSRPLPYPGEVGDEVLTPSNYTITVKKSDLYQTITRPMTWVKQIDARYVILQDLDISVTD